MTMTTDPPLRWKKMTVCGVPEVVSWLALAASPSPGRNSCRMVRHNKVEINRERFLTFEEIYRLGPAHDAVQAVRVDPGVRRLPYAGATNSRHYVGMRWISTREMWLTLSRRPYRGRLQAEDAGDAADRRQPPHRPGAR